MRDIGRYPITLDECIEAIETAERDYIARWRGSEVRFGDTHVLALREAAVRLRRLQFATNGKF